MYDGSLQAACVPARPARCLAELISCKCASSALAKYVKMDGGAAVKSARIWHCEYNMKIRRRNTEIGCISVKRVHKNPSTKIVCIKKSAILMQYIFFHALASVHGCSKLLNN